MNRVYSDLHLQPDPKDSSQVQKMIHKAAKLGYRQIAVPIPPRYDEQDIKQIRDICTRAEVDLVTRVDIKSHTTNELLRKLRKLRRKFEIISVVCESKKVSRQAAKDRRVDLLNFSQAAQKWLFDEAEAKLASGSLTALEIDASPLLAREGPARIRILSRLHREAARAKAHEIPIVLSSGARSELEMRRPSELAALSALFDLDKCTALDSVSKNPTSIVKRNREKLDPRFVAPGIRVIKEGKDC